MLTIDTLTHAYGTGPTIFDGFSLSLRPGEITAILGGSGSGKSTLLRLIAGLELPKGGQITLDGRPLDQNAQRRARSLGIVFQEPRLMPWLSVRKNIGFALSHLSKAERARRVEQTIQRVGLEHRADALPSALSGGQAQRVALARALVTQPLWLLLDEPFSALDPLIRARLHRHLLDLWRDSQPGMIIVTHDIDEALALSDRILVLGDCPAQVIADHRPRLPRPHLPADPAVQQFRAKLIRNLERASGVSLAA